LLFLFRGVAICLFVVRGVEGSTTFPPTTTKMTGGLNPRKLLPSGTYLDF